MRPLRLSMTAFGPYAETEVVDFDALAELGLFAVAGNNGSGKTTIFDGLYFALYGSLPGRRATYYRLRSDHARPDVECRVELDFVAHGERWRIERFPRQESAKRRGTGRTERQQRATLFRFVDGQPVAVVNKIRAVDERCRELVGLSGSHFERVALLPQGEFSRLLQESGTKRGDLLRTLFSADVFGRATKLLVDDAAAVEREHRVVDATLDERLTRIATAVTGLIGSDRADGLVGVGGSGSDQAEGLVGVGGSGSDQAEGLVGVGGSGPTGADPVAILEAIDRFEATDVEALASQVDRLRSAANDAGAAVQAARSLRARIEQRAGTIQAAKEHAKGKPGVERDLKRLEAARAAVPVVSMAEAAAGQAQAHDAMSLRVAQLGNKLEPLVAELSVNLAQPDSETELDAAVSEIDREIDRLAALTAATEEANRLQAAVAALAETAQSLRDQRAKTQASRVTLETRRSELDDERQQLVAAPAETDAHAAHQAALDRVAARVDLHELDRGHEALRTERSALAARRASLDDQLGQLETARRRHGELNDAANAAADALAEAHLRRERYQRLSVAMSAHDVAVSELARAEAVADATFQAFVRGTSARLAETLVDGEPCSVCGATEHPAPAPSSTDVCTEEQVGADRAVADRARHHKGRLEHEIKTLLHGNPDLKSATIDDVDEQIELAKRHAITTENAANNNARTIADLERIQGDVADAVARDRALDEQLADLNARRNRAIGALGDDARASVEQLRGLARQTAVALDEARAGANRVATIATELATVTDRARELELTELDIDKRLTATETELAARADDYERAARLLVETGLAERDSDRALGSPPVQLDRARTARQVLDQMRAAIAKRTSDRAAAERAQRALAEKLEPSPFATVEAAERAFLEPSAIADLEASTSAWVQTSDRLQGELQSLADVPDIGPDLESLTDSMIDAEDRWRDQHQILTRQREACQRLRGEITELADERRAQTEASADARRVERLAAVVKGDNDHNLSLENWVLAAHLREVVDLANVRLAASSQQRFQLCVVDEGESRRGRWGLDLAVEDTVTGTRRPTAGLSGGELFQASLALALGLADVVMNQRSGVRIDALFVDEGFGSLDETSVERVIDLLDEVRSRGAMVGVISHVPTLLDALPRGITVTARADGGGSTINQEHRAA